jgi:hypothetical protein
MSHQEQLRPRNGTCEQMAAGRIADVTHRRLRCREGFFTIMQKRAGFRPRGSGNVHLSIAFMFR